VTSAKPCVYPTLQTRPVKPQAPTPGFSNKATYNDAFAAFLNKTKAPGEEETAKPAAPKSIPAAQPKVEPVKPSALSYPQLHEGNLPNSNVEVQRKQQEWTEGILKQTQMQQKASPPSQQRVKAERIVPYVSGQNQMFSTPASYENGQVFYKVKSNGSQPSQQKQQYC